MNDDKYELARVEVFDRQDSSRTASQGGGTRRVRECRECAACGDSFICEAWSESQICVHCFALARRDALIDELLAALKEVVAFLDPIEWADLTAEHHAANLEYALRAVIEKAEGRS